MAKVRKSDIKITTVYEIDCKACGQAVYPDDRVLTREEAEQVRADHLAEHDRGEL
jgi:hypothetical protein